MVSRAVEAGAVARFLVAAANEPSVLVVQGEPGIGKTTLWVAGIEQARAHGFRVLSAHAAARCCWRRAVTSMRPRRPSSGRWSNTTGSPCRSNAHARNCCWAELQRRRRQKDAAAATLGEALRTFEDLDTPLWADRVRADLTRTNVTSKQTTGLTPSELRVAELAASGMTNRDVSAALFISPKTVEANLSRIYRKLHIHSRAELGRYMSQPDG